MQLSLGSIASFVVFLLLPSMNHADHHSNIFLRGPSYSQPVPMLKPCTLLGRYTEHENGLRDFSWDCELDPDDAGGQGRMILPIEGISMPRNFRDGDGQPLLSGKSTMSTLGCVIIDSADGPRIHVPSASNLGFHRRQLIQAQNRRLAEGDKRILVVKVRGSDASTSSSVTALSDSVFGTRGDPVNLASRYAACSYEKLNMLPGTQPAGASLPVRDGVVEVTIPNTISGANDNVIRNAVTRELSRNGFDLPGNYDHVMYCLPPGTGSWLAYAYIDDWLSVYNDDWCTYVSTQVHEIGHNLDLDHSGERNDEYDDLSGMMGYSYREDDTPEMCFNGPKSWQLGWYRDRHSIVSPLSSCWNGDLVGLADYRNSADETVVLKINTRSNTDFYVNFNRQIGINSGTREGGDQVLITTQGGEGTTSSESRLLAKLNAGGSYSINNFDSSGETVTVTVNSISTPGSYTVASVTVARAGTPCSTPTARPTARPTVPPTVRPSSPVTPRPSFPPTVRPTPSSRPNTPPTPRPNPFPTPRPTATRTDPPTPPILVTPLPTPSKTPNPTSTVTTSPREVCTDVEYIVTYIGWSGLEFNPCSAFDGDTCRETLVDGGYVFEVCQATCSQYDEIKSHSEWIGCTPPPTCINLQSSVGYTCPNGNIISVSCSSLNYYLCGLPVAGGGPAFEICQETCSRYDAIKCRPDWIHCTPP